jgi:hypothetical protein
MNSIARISAAGILAAVFSCCIVLATPAFGATKTLTGIVTDMACGKSHSLMKGNGTDAQCVRTCVKGGSAYGLVVGDQVVQLSGHSAELNRYAAKKVTVQGSMKGKDFVVESVKPAK